MKNLRTTSQRRTRRAIIDGIVHRGRQRKLLRFYEEREAALQPTAPPVSVFAILAASNYVFELAHGFGNGAGPHRFDGSPPAGAVGDKPYFLAVDGPDAYRLSRRRPTARADLELLDITSDAGSPTRQPDMSPLGLLSVVQAGLHPRQVRDATDADDVLFA